MNELSIASYTIAVILKLTQHDLSVPIKYNQLVGHNHAYCRCNYITPFSVFHRLHANIQNTAFLLRKIRILEEMTEYTASETLPLTFDTFVINTVRSYIKLIYIR